MGYQVFGPSSDTEVAKEKSMKRRPLLFRLLVALNFILQSTLAFAKPTEKIGQEEIYQYSTRLAQQTAKHLKQAKNLHEAAKPFLVFETAGDKKFLEAQITANMKIPAIKVDKNILTFEAEGQKLEFEIVNPSENVYKINGYQFKYNTKQPAKERLAYIERILKHKKTSRTGLLFNLFMSEAHGGGQLLLVAAAVVIVAVYLPLVAETEEAKVQAETLISFRNRHPTDNIQLKCSTFDKPPYKFNIISDSGKNDSSLEVFSQEFEKQYDKVFVKVVRSCCGTEDLPQRETCNRKFNEVFKKPVVPEAPKNLILPRPVPSGVSG
jgi:hypothetical protein